MATEKTLKTRVKMKHGKESEWALATKFTPLIGEIIVYDVDNNHTSPRFKVGDGLTNVNNLKFVNQDELAKITTLGDELLAVKNGYVPNTRTINSKPLSANISLTASDVGAAASSHTHSYLPLSGGTVTGALTVNKELYSNAAVISKRNSSPQFILQNANGAPLGMLYMNTTTGGYSSAYLRVYSSASAYSTFNFGNDGKLSCGSLALATALPISSGGTGSTTASGALTNLGALPLTGGTLTGTLTATALYASDGDVTGVHLITKTNNYPEVYFKNATGATLADLWVDTTTGSYAPVILRVHADASTSKDFTFGKDGTFSIPNSFSTVMGEFKSNAWPQMFFRNGNGNALVQLVVPTDNGSYNGLAVNVFSNASTNVQYTFNSDGTFKVPFAVQAARTYVRTNNYPEHIFQNANGVTLAELYANTTSGAYAPIILRVKQSVDGFSEFTFGKDGTFTAPAGITTTGNYISIKNNSYPQLTFSNASGADIGKFFVSTTNGSYAATKIRAYSSASSYYDFQFLGTGSFSCKTINADGIDIGADSLVQLSQNDNKGSGCISIGNINLGDWRVISVADDGRLLIDYTNPIYALGSSVIYSSSQPSSPTTGMIWLKPV